jgi:4-amino-4-deoxy-L-arabinose transferase-like glycosyltransferase
VTRPLAPTSFLILLLLLLPSLLLLWRFDDMPQFGELHDDSIYYVGAKSLAETQSYSIASLPGEPSQTKYPPLYPLLLSIAWRMDPSFPHNLATAAWISWLAWPALLIALALYCPRLGLTPGRTWILLVLMAVNPFCILFSGRLISELFFTVLLLLALLLVDRAAEQDAGTVTAIAAGIIAGLAYLTRTAGIILLASGFLFLWLRKQRPRAITFAAAMLPFILAWTLWGRLHQLPTTDPDLIYYTSYLGEQFNNVTLTSLPLFLWKNLDGLLSGLGSLVLPQVLGVGFLKILAEVIAVAMIAGVVRLVRRGDGLHYALFAAMSCVVLLLWHFPPNERLVLPLFPLALAGLLVELEHFFRLMGAGLKHREIGQKVVAGLMIAIAVVIFAGSLTLQVFTGINLIPDATRAQRKANVPNRAAYAWIRAKTPEDANFFAYFDPLLYLYSGRHAMSHPLPPALWYHDDHEAILKLYLELVPYARAHRLSYILLNDADFRGDMTDQDRARLEQSIRQNPGLEHVWEDGSAAIYRVLP